MSSIVSEEEQIAYTEVYDIIMFMDKNEREKIPNSFVEFLKHNKKNNYITKINPYIPLEFQNLKKITKNIIAYIYRRYLADEEERKYFMNLEE
ncbi:MAG: hypothetical protein IKF38_03110 [Clostridia bacterium]|nr:hypothetical protein [Clostridia bacterium]